MSSVRCAASARSARAANASRPSRNANTPDSPGCAPRSGNSIRPSGVSVTACTITVYSTAYPPPIVEPEKRSGARLFRVIPPAARGSRPQFYRHHQRRPGLQGHTVMTPQIAVPPRMPAAFLAHGSPMNAMEKNRFSRSWQAFGASVPRPRAILMVSAHWYTTVTAVTAMAQPRTIHNFYGFPRELFEVEYPAPGDPALAEEIADVARPVVVGRDRDSWGLDHGTWSVLVHAFPNADIPVVQLSIDARQTFDFHFDLGARLHKLRETGILIIGSGNVVHNLRAVYWSQPDHGFDWARRFDDAARKVLTTRPEDVVRLQEHPDFPRAVPTP